MFSNIFWIFTPILVEDFQFDEHIFQMGWFNHQLATKMGVFETFESQTFGKT